MSCCCPDSPPPKRKPGQSPERDHVVTKQPRKEQSPQRDHEDKRQQRNGVDRDRHRDDRDRRRETDHHQRRDDNGRHGDRSGRPSGGDKRSKDDRPVSPSHVRVDEKSRPSSGSADPKVMADLEKLLERLEKVTTRLESVATSGGGGGPSAGQDGRLKGDVHDAMRLCEAVSQKISSGKDRGSSPLRERFGRRLHDIRGRLRDLEKRLDRPSSGVGATGPGE